MSDFVLSWHCRRLAGNLFQPICTGASLDLAAATAAVIPRFKSATVAACPVDPLSALSSKTHKIKSGGHGDQAVGP